MLPKSGKGRPLPARRSTVDDRMSCLENGDLNTNIKISSGESADQSVGPRLVNFMFAVPQPSDSAPARLSDPGPQTADDDASAPRGGASPAAAGRSQGRRADAVQVRRETLPRPLLRQQTQLVSDSPSLRWNPRPKPQNLNQEIRVTLARFIDFCKSLWAAFRSSPTQELYQEILLHQPE